MRWLLFLFFCTPLSALTQSKNEPNGVSFGLNYLGGKVLIHTPRVYLLPGSYPQAVELSYKKQTLGKKAWHQRFGFPEVSLNIAYTHYDYSYFGSAFGFYPAIQFRILPIGKGQWFFKVGGGLGAVTKHYERAPISDSFDLFIGSTINNFTMFQSAYKFNLSTHWSAQIGMHYYNVSNAATRQPNFGINAFGGFAGLNYHPEGIIKHIEKKQWPKYKNPLNLKLYAAISFAEGKAFDGPLFPVYTYSGSAVKMYRNKNRVSVGMNAVFNTKTLSFIKNVLFYKDDFRRHTWQYAAFIENEFLFGKIGLPLQLGFYLNNPLTKKLMYQKVGMNYHFYHHDKSLLKDMHLSLILYTHTSRAQYAELGLGILL